MTRFLELDHISAGNALAYTVAGSGAAIVIVHGVGGHKEDWAAVQQELAQSAEVFAIDMLGFGESGKAGDDLSIPVQAAAIAALLDAHGHDRATLIGNSVGGWVAAGFAAAFPARTERLVLIDAAGFRAMFEGEPPVNFDPSTVEEMQALIDICINGPVARTPGLAQAALDRYVASGEKAVSPVWGKSIYGSPRLEDLLGAITAPTVVLWGADDRLFPAVLAGVFAAQVAGARSELIAGAGHFPQIDRPEATLAAIRAALAD